MTGASSGIGRSLTLALAGGGCAVVACARRETGLKALAEEIRRDGGRCLVEELDVADTARTVERIRALDEAHRFELIVANAGVGAREGVAPWTWEGLGDAIEIDFAGAAATLTAALPAMVSRGRGHLVAVSSLASYGPLPASAAYCAPKAGLDMLMECLRIDLAGTGVRVTNVRAGFVRTRMVAKTTHPMPGMMEPDEAAERILKGLERAPAEIVFPRWLAAMARASGALPRPLRDALLRVVIR
ncbi:MAG: SDR family NAD(P)-dependent oxidoreductase [Polyangiales bacterium]